MQNKWHNPKRLLIRIEYAGAKRANGNLLVKFVKEIEGVSHKVIAEVRPGKRNRNLAVYNYYKR